MAILRSFNPTLLDLKTRLKMDGGIDDVVEILVETNEILEDMTWIEGNLATGHRSTIRTGLPEAYFRRLNMGVPQAKSTTVQVDDNTGMMEVYAEVDKALADLNGNTAEFRLSEEVAFIEGINQKVANSLFYENTGTLPEGFDGLAPRFNDLSAANADNIIDAGGTGSDNGSIWLVVWGPQTCHGIYPKGSVAGLQVHDKGQVTVQTTVSGIPGVTDDSTYDQGRMEVYQTHYRWDLGLTVRDWRYIVRICNIDKSDLSTVFTNGAFSAGANLPQLMFRAMRLIPKMNRGRPVFYMSRDMATRVAEQLASMGASSWLTMDETAGSESMTERFKGVKMARVDALSADEARVT